MFNLIPIPPLDGSKILFAFLPDKIVYKIYEHEREINLVLILLIAFGVLTGPLSNLQGILTTFIMEIVGIPFMPLIY